MNWGLILANIAAFILERRFPGLVGRYHLDPRRPVLITYFTYALLHANTLHLASNMLFLYIFGNNVNDKMGHIAYLGFYLAGGVFAGIGHVLADQYPVIGASGAVAAVTGAYLVLFPRSHITVLYWFFFIGTYDVPSVWFVAIFFAQDFFLNFARAPDHIAHMAHISGTLFGFAVCFGLLAGRLLPRGQFDVVALVQRWNQRRQYRDMVSRGYDPFGYARPPESLPSPTDPAVLKIQELRRQISEAIADHKHPEGAALYLELKKLDPQQVLSRQAQLEIANQLASQQLYVEAAEAYEQFLQHYRNFEQIEQVELMLGLVYARYLQRYDRARELLLRALARLHGQRELDLARTELQRIEPLIGQPTDIPGRRL
jgi:membrane associated rhomboid family serine protease